MSLITEILDDVARWPTPLQEIVPVNYGEFFMLTQWRDILEMIASKLPDTGIVLPTNGSLLTIPKIRELCRIPTIKIINLSLNAYFDETYEEFMGLSSETLHLLIELISQEIHAQRPDITIWASMVHDPAYQTDLERDLFKAKCLSRGMVPQIINAASAGRDDKAVKIENTIPCRSIFSDIVIGFDRKLSSCCWDAGFTLDLGDYSGDLHQDWHNTALTSFRDAHNKHLRGGYRLCRKCTSA